MPGVELARLLVHSAGVVGAFAVCQALFKALSRTHKVLALSELPFYCEKKKINEEIQRILSAADECYGEKCSRIRDKNAPTGGERWFLCVVALEIRWSGRSG